MASTPPLEAEYAALTVLDRVEIDHAESAVRDAAEAADQVDLDRQLELLDRVRLRGLCFLVPAHGLGGVGDSRAIDQDTLLPVRLPRLREGGCDLLVRGHVDLAEYSANVSGHRLASRRIAIEHGDFRAAPGELARGRFAEARRRAGDDRGNSVDVHS